MKKEKRKMKKLINVFITGGLFVTLLTSCNVRTTSDPVVLPIETVNSTISTVNPIDESTETTQTVTEPVTETQVEPTIEPIEINLIAVGDMIPYGGTHNRASLGNGSYDYSFIFEHTKDRITAADLAIVNEESILGGTELGISSYPNFNSPYDLGDYLVDAGFDVIQHASNHSLDAKVQGVINTINYWKTNHPEITVLGINESQEMRDTIRIVDCKGIKIAMLNYTYGLNGYSLPADMPYLVNLMTEETKPSIANDIKQAKELADFVIVFPHWGIEYDIYANSSQREWAQFFADNGADLIIGTHPHVVQPVELLTSADGRDVLVYYSLGNFNSIQYYDFSMLGGFAEVTLKKDSSGTYIKTYNMDFLVTHYTIPNPNRNVITTYFLNDYSDELANVHGIKTEPFQYDISKGKDTYTSINTTYPFTMDGLWNLARTICPQFVK